MTPLGSLNVEVRTSEKHDKLELITGMVGCKMGKSLVQNHLFPPPPKKKKKQQLKPSMPQLLRIDTSGWGVNFGALFNKV